ncbi:carbohydrate ABC transporter permease [Ketogulonicigenium vulgare]|uniref:Probable sugar ABC transporter, permease protein n=1 Tax=Ketogulonicigenium vulgare (strain WSH-001) TaxID=759362 RepID=F9YB85_KETVW|nr:carbohydrate ABC transporter permease [Ketogulonicigenium vulgare]ADO44113.1 sugar ABC transporter, permease protein [Ketogulonicigenium vulgare Y25]AEM42637.1 probable sugar ABC transporter, permease protein [Ketogulonicigenium vulgare WSH-001]ALJ82443.1 sugar ABC transporter permease [Ketogulonicigenium vulgare]ANW35231.1 sugar ABC transporter permease [Ketogulonicigenium vulgare]AOZ53339.1 sugar ABC transporter, permease protein [Ketogulonicigenium vulgare]
MSPIQSGPAPRKITIGRIGLYLFLISMVAFFALPLFVMLITSLKTDEEIRLARIFALPASLNFSAWATAWSGACAGTICNGVQAGFWNSIQITVPAVAISVMLGALNGYALSFWQPKGGKILFALLMAGALVPYQIFLYPMVRALASVSLYNSLPGIVLVHVLFGLPLVTLLFRNYFITLPVELFKAARIDGAGFWRIFFEIMLPMSVPMVVVAAMLQFTGIWNDFLLGLVFAGPDNLPMTVQLNNIVNTTTGSRAYNVDMAATMLTALVPLSIYFLSGRWFVRGIAAGAVKG